ncbi:nucleic acid/nucleotide deaminase domain-containing protein [Kitasatospora sp. NPDC059571]|uniref:nucleic acid/nucleotide deaminase domain-containing protein n=1 Tax=Kitasatospora sp. NPDC059571 TaxID=3346871 RepID=UPI003675FCAF
MPRSPGSTRRPRRTRAATGGGTRRCRTRPRTRCTPSLAVRPVDSRRQGEGSVLRTGPGYSAAVKFRTPDGAERSEVARSGPGLPHPEWQLHERLASLGVPAGDVRQLYTELQVCDVPGGNCAAQVRRWWPDVQLSHSAEYGIDEASRQRGLAVLRAHLVEAGRRRGFEVDMETRRLPLPAAAETGAAGAASDRPVGLPPSFEPFFERAAAEGVPLADHLAAEGVALTGAAAELCAERGYLRLGTDFGRDVCTTPATGEVWAVGRRSGGVRYVNRTAGHFASCLDLLRRTWPGRRGLGPDDAARHTADFQQALVALDGTALGDPENWWSVVVEQMWDGLL